VGKVLGFIREGGSRALVQPARGGAQTEPGPA